MNSTAASLTKNVDGDMSFHGEVGCASKILQDYLSYFSSYGNYQIQWLV